MCSGDDTVWCKYCGCRLDLDGCGQWQSRRQVRPGEEPSSSSSTAVHLHYHHPLEFCHQDHLPRHLSDHPDSLTAMLHFHHLEVCHQHHCQLCFCHQHQHHPDICHQNKQCCIIIIQSFVTSTNLKFFTNTIICRFFCHQEQGTCYQPSFLSSPFSPSGRPCVFLRSKS